MNQDVGALIVIFASFGFLLLFFCKKLLSRDAILFANIFGITIYFLGGLETFFTVLIFFLLAEMATFLGRKNSKPHERRGISNIIGNGMPSLVALFFGSQIGFYGGLSAALSDTMSSEIGLLSKNKPRLITNMKKQVPPGTDGGITLDGTIAGLAGAFLIGFCFFSFAYKNSSMLKSLLGFFIITISGFFGCLTDSLFGALFENKGKLSNTEVNLAGSSTGVLLAHLLWSIFSI
ncbi:MAG: DUF92 domain-containing protein [Candidatus Diapherotrites archaeon]